MLSSRVDEKGRLKLPIDAQRFLESIGATQVFITSFDGITARIYPIPEWDAVEQLLEGSGEGSSDGADLLYLANTYGSDAVIDGQGRLLLPPELRRAMGVENAPVRLVFSRGHLAVVSETKHEERLAGADSDAADKLKRAIDRGLR